MIPKMRLEFRLLSLLFCTVFVQACAPKNEGTEIFLPKIKSPLGADLEALRKQYCDGVRLNLDNVLTEDNFRSVFNCANFDGSLDPLRPLITSKQFPEFIDSINSIVRSDSTQDLRESLRPWLEEKDGESKADRLLPTLSSLIKNPAFQEGLPVIQNILEAGEETWGTIFPAIGTAIYSERFPDTFDDILALFENASPAAESKAKAQAENKKDKAKTIKQYAELLKTKIENKSVTLHILELAEDLEKIEIEGTSLKEYLDQMNVKGVFISLYQENGRLRGEQLNPKLNADPEEEELRDGIEFTPEQRRKKALRKLFAPGEDGSEAPIVQLAGLVQEFQKPHSQFLPAFARWFSGNGQKVSEGFFDYVAKALIRICIPKVNVESFLLEYAANDGADAARPVDQDAFQKFLESAFQSDAFANWLTEKVDTANKEEFGEKNAKFLAVSKLKQELVALYEAPEVARYGRGLIAKGKSLALNTVIKRFSNLHRSDKLQFERGGKTQNLELHMVDAWLSASQTALGESVVVEFGIELAQTFFTEFASEFAAKDGTLSEWYFSGAYSNPGTTESLAGYAVKELQLLDTYYKKKDYLLNEFGPQVFTNADDLRAFRALVEQIPNIWLYIKSGMSRSGSDLTRALAEKDSGYLTKNYVRILAKAQELGLISRGAKIIHAYHKIVDAEGISSEEEVPYEDKLSERRRISKGTDALKRVLEAFFEPEEEGKYETTTLSRLLTPLRALVNKEKRSLTERALLKGADEILASSDATINNFFDAAAKEKRDPKTKRADRRETMKTISELLQKQDLPKIVRHLNHFFQEDAVKPALDFLSQKIDDGTLKNTLLFIRRVLGIQG